MEINNKQMTERDTRLVLSTLGLVDAMAARYAGQGAAEEDLRQEGYLALCHAAMRYDEGRGTKFSTYAYPYVRKAMQRLLPLYNPAPWEEVAEEVVDDTPDYNESDDSLLALTRAISVLTPLEKNVIDALYGLAQDAVGEKEIAKRLRITPDHVYKVKRRALRKMRVKMNKTI